MFIRLARRRCVHLRSQWPRGLGCFPARIAVIAFPAMVLRHEICGVKLATKATSAQYLSSHENPLCQLIRGRRPPQRIIKLRSPSRALGARFAQRKVRGAGHQVFWGDARSTYLRYTPPGGVQHTLSSPHEKICSLRLRVTVRRVLVSDPADGLFGRRSAHLPAVISSSYSVIISSLNHSISWRIFMAGLHSVTCASPDNMPAHITLLWCDLSKYI
jgi:hypothetical protein